MTVTAKLVDGRTLEFPDGTPPEVVQSTVKRMIAGGTSGNDAVALPRENPAISQIDRFLDAADKAPYDAGGYVAERAAKTGASPEVAGGLGYAANVALQAIPMVLGGGAAKVAAPVFESAGKSLMQSALKPGIKDLLNGKGQRAAQTMLDEGINVSSGGVQKLQGEISKQAQLADALINGANGSVKKDVVASRLQDTMKTYEKQADPLGDMGAIQGVYDRFLQHPLINGNDIPIKLAQELKKGTYARLADKYGPLNPETASVAAEKALARGLREEIEKAVPQVGPTNERLADLLNASRVAQRRALVEGNKNPTGLATLASSPIAALGQMVDRSSILKSLLARALYSGSNAIPATAARSGIAADLVGNERGTQ